MQNKPFSESHFTPTQWSTAKEKADFGNWLVRFIESGVKRSLFPKTKYRRLSMCFSHIAHYNVQGFYSEWFENGPEKWIDYIIDRPIYGDPSFTYSDVEREMVKYARKNWILF